MGAITWSRPRVFLLGGATGFLGAVVGFTAWVVSLRMIAEIQAEEYNRDHGYSLGGPHGYDGSDYA